MVNDYIDVKKASTNNLKNISVKIPKHKIVAVTGISGSGKSSFVFDTIASESQRFLNETYSAYIQNLLPKYKKAELESISNLPLSLVIDQKRIRGNSRSTVGTITGIYQDLRLLYSRIASPFVGYSMKYSFNNPEGMCKRCQGLGTVRSIDIKKLIDFDKSLNEGAIDFPSFKNKGWRLTRYTESGFFDNDKKIGDYSKDELDLLLYSDKIKPRNPSKNWHKTAWYMGLVPRIMESFVNVEKTNYKKELDSILIEDTCPVCHGDRLDQEVLKAKIRGLSIADCSKMEADDLLDFLEEIDDERVESIIERAREKLKSLLMVGLSYLKINQPTSSLSGGEASRIKMVTYLNSPLSDVLYIFDEPSVGLHPEDLKGIISIFKSIRDRGNSILLVDHDPYIIRESDYIINFGEGAGSDGGEISFQGTYKELLKSDTLTGKALSKKRHINKERKNFEKFYELDKVHKHNIKNISVKIPQNAITLVTGPAGSGKSTLIRKLFTIKYPKATILDQTLPQAMSSSNIISYLNIYDEIKKVFAKANDVDKSIFSARGKGACPECKGRGTIKIDLAYMPAYEGVCEKCQGKKFNNKALSYLYRGKNISQVFDLTAREAKDLFYDNDLINRGLEAIIKANLSYVKLGQGLDTYSGGELQRLKIGELLLKHKSDIIILDEPTTGLHEYDIEKLMDLIHELVNRGNSLIIIEHNLSVISQADWIIDLGPKGGKLGGELVFEGYPIDFIKDKKSFTARHLREFLKIEK